MSKRIGAAAAYALGALAMGAAGAAGMLMGDGASVLGVNAAAVAGNIQDNFAAIADLMGGGAYLAGAAFGIQAALKFKAHNENPQQVKLSQPLTYALVAGALLALPTWLTTGKDTLFDSGTATKISGNKLGGS